MFADPVDRDEFNPLCDNLLEESLVGCVLVELLARGVIDVLFLYADAFYFSSGVHVAKY